MLNVLTVGLRCEYQPLDDRSSVLSYLCYCLLILQPTQDVVMGSSILDTPANSGLLFASTVVTRLSTQGIISDSVFTVDELPGIAPTMHTGSAALRVLTPLSWCLVNLLDMQIPIPLPLRLVNLPDTWVPIPLPLHLMNLWDT
jgi:hypothetical protein